MIERMQISSLVFLTDDCDAAWFGHLDHFVHHVLRPFGEVVPLKHTDWAVPHNLLGSAHSLCVCLGALWSAVQTLRRGGRNQTTVISACITWMNQLLHVGVTAHGVSVWTKEISFLTIQPAGMPPATVAMPTVAFSSNLSAVTKSTGSVILTPFFSALAIRSLTMPAPSSSYREVPI